MENHTNQHTGQQGGTAESTDSCGSGPRSGGNARTSPLMPVNQLGGVVGLGVGRVGLRVSLEAEAVRVIALFNARCPYAEEIHLYHKDKERAQRDRTNVDVLSIQAEITPAMRTILVNWLGEVTDEYHLAQETLFLAVHYLDKFLNHKQLRKTKFQLVGIVCLLVACKFEEIEAPCVDDIVYITDGAYSRREILEAELTVLGQLNFTMACTTIRNFLPRFLCLAELEKHEIAKPFTQYLSELCIADYTINQAYLPSMISASIIFITRGVLINSSECWTLVLTKYTGYTEKDLRNCVYEICNVHNTLGNGRHPTAKDKYKALKYGCVSLATFSMDSFKF